ncbi:hypothetical protein AGMMS50284_2290 [Clostridia bacterium]|nr:hypothetical protein AGMMS50284_2290 [Clostridia bacterium]
MQNTEKQNSKRIHFIDELRGAAIVIMVLYHLFFSMAFVFNMPSGAALLNIIEPFGPSAAGTFILLSGVSSMLSRSNLLRGVRILIIALVITIVTTLFVPEFAINFGILHFMGIAMILFSFIKKWIVKIPIQTGLAITSILFILTKNIPNGVFGIYEILSVKLPAVIYSTNFLFPLGFPSPTFASGDYFPLIPWIFLFLLGTFLGIPVSKGIVPPFMLKNHVKPLSFLGRHSLVIYVVHQPFIVAVLYLINLFFG